MGAVGQIICVNAGEKASSRVIFLVYLHMISPQKTNSVYIYTTSFFCFQYTCDIFIQDAPPNFNKKEYAYENNIVTEGLAFTG